MSGGAWRTAPGMHSAQRTGNVGDLAVVSALALRVEDRDLAVRAEVVWVDDGLKRVGTAMRTRVPRDSPLLQKG